MSIITFLNDSFIIVVYKQTNANTTKAICYKSTISNVLLSSIANILYRFVKYDDTNLVVVSIGVAVGVINQQCTTSAQCGSTYEHCDTGACRLFQCAYTANCQSGEICISRNDGTPYGKCVRSGSQAPGKCK
jgi:hypothetical protein